MSAEAEWLATSPPRNFTDSFHFDRRIPFSDSRDSYKSTTSPLSSSVSSSFAYQPPTSPLAQSVTNDDIDFASQFRDSGFLSSRIEATRRSLHGFDGQSPFTSPSRGSRLSGTTSLRRDSPLPYQAHQPRRSLNSTPNFLLPQTPGSNRSRRPSFGSDSSPLQHASMVGSYEESILRGRMSTTPSKPFDFLAQIGVLGKGKCKSSLRCPAHVTLPFPAVYYSYSNTSHGRSQTNDGPSPYVGQVDLENGLPNPDEESRFRRKLHSRYVEHNATNDAMDVDMVLDGPEPSVQQDRKSRKRSSSPKAPPGGSYRIPEKGQIQIVVKNQNKTAVKLFLVPYDLAGMTPGTKTFIRQRSYTQGPIIEDVPQLSQANTAERPTLRYLVHLHICCPSRGRFYLYRTIRIVFANRVPEGKEKLRNDTTWPEPRFSPYKPTRNPPQSSGPGAMLAIDKAYRRRSLGMPTGASHRSTLSTEGILPPTRRSDLDPPSSYASGNTLPIDPIPFRGPTINRVDSDMSDSQSNVGNMRSPGSSQTSRPSTKDSARIGSWEAHQYEKLNKGDFGYGGNAFGIIDSASPGTAEGLLSQRLRSLGVDQSGLFVKRPMSPPEK